MKRKWILLVVPILILIWLLNVSRPGRAVIGCLEGCAVPGVETSRELRVISLNMLHGFPKFDFLSDRLALIAGEITRLDADIVLLQEVPWTLKMRSAAQFLAEKTGMNYAYLRANGNRWTILFEEGEAILSRFPLTNPEFVQLRPEARFFENRVALHVVAHTSQGEVDLFVTHLTHTDPEINFEQIQVLTEFVEETRNGLAIIAGDFNAPPDSPQIQLIQSFWIDTFALVNPGAAGLTCCTDNLTSSAPVHHMRIDFIFIAPGDSVPNIHASRLVFDQPFPLDGWLWASDHIGVMADVEILK